MKNLKRKIKHLADIIPAVFSGDEYFFMKLQNDSVSVIQHSSHRSVFKGLKSYWRYSKIESYDVISNCFNIDNEIKKMEAERKKEISKLPEELQNLLDQITKDFKNGK